MDGNSPEKETAALVRLNVAVRLAVESLDELPQTVEPQLREDVRALIGRIEAETERLSMRLHDTH